jgi:hypothetical protein
MMGHRARGCQDYEVSNTLPPSGNPVVTRRIMRVTAIAG